MTPSLSSLSLAVLAEVVNARLIESHGIRKAI
jgi:hypothetical protein